MKLRHLLVTSILIVSQLSAAIAAINDGLLAHYTFDGNANDASGNGNHATAYNNYSYEGGVLGDAIHLVGSGHTGLSGGHVLLPSFPLDTMDEFTIGMWVNWEGNSTSSDESFVSFGRSTSGNSIYGMNYVPSTERIGFYGGGPWSAGVSAVATPFPSGFQNNWHHLTLQVDNGTLTGFVNGQSIGTDSYTKPTSSTLENVAGIGAHWFDSGGTSSNRFIGSVDDVRIWDRALSSSEVTSLANPTAHLLFREGDGVHEFWDELTEFIKGWDHVGLAVGNTVYESHPEYDAGQYWDPVAESYVSIESEIGVQSQHSVGSFLHKSKTTTSPVLGGYLSIPFNLALEMQGHIEGKLGAKFRTLTPANLTTFIANYQPSQQKGADGDFTCVGLIEWAAEQAGLNNGHGFIRNSDETIDIGGVTVPLLSPELLSWTAGAADEYWDASSFGDYILGALDPADFLLTDPLGRRFGYVEGLGFVDEIPGAMYSGDGIFEQFLILNPMKGEYDLELYGVGEEAMAGVRSKSTHIEFNGFLSEGQDESFSIMVVPEPTTSLLATFALCLGCGRGRRRG